FRILLFCVATSSGVDELHRRYARSERRVTYRLMCYELAVIKVGRRKRHNVLMHPILYLEHRGGRGLVFDASLEKGGGEARVGCFTRLDRGRQLMMIAGEDDSTGAHNRNPARGFQRLCGLVDKHGPEGP